MIVTREMRRQLERDNAKHPVTLAPIHQSDWPVNGRSDKLIEVWRSRYFIMQVFRETDGVVRLSVNRTTHDGNDWDENITWEELQELKRQCGRGDMDAVEIYPADGDVVNVANMRHLWVVPWKLAFKWTRLE